jgi:predicted site-specific integrase-resolvase
MITSTRPSVALDGRYTVTQTCAALGIHRGTLQRYTERGDIKPVFRRVDGRKVYIGKDIIRLWLSSL